MEGGRAQGWREGEPRDGGRESMQWMWLDSATSYAIGQHTLNNTKTHSLTHTY